MARSATSRWGIILQGIVLVAFFLSIGCEERKLADKEPPADTSPGDIQVPAQMFPHPDQWEDPASHGAWVIESGDQVCFKCHQQFPEEERQPPTCSWCHPLYPHTSDWVNEEAHGNTFLIKGRSACATKCHGEDLDGGISKIGCESCHQLYPHSATWEQDHREAALTLGNNVCRSCHGSNFERVFDGKNCFSCHDDYPHPAGAVWSTYAGGHGEKVRVTYEGKTTSCQPCHGVDLLEYKKGKNCFSCHPKFPHAENWSLGTEHGTYFSSNSLTSLSTGNCFNCHGNPVAFDNDQDEIADLAPTCTTSPDCPPSTCYKCHWSYPHKGYQTTVDYPWKPQGHVVYMINSPLMIMINTDEQEVHPEVDFSHVDEWKAAIIHTCAGSISGSCHFNGYRSNQLDPPEPAGSEACWNYCHLPD